MSTFKSTSAKTIIDHVLNTKNHEYVNLFVHENTNDETTGGEDKPFVTWCIGPVKDGVFYGVHVSVSDLLPDDDSEVIVVNMNDCQPLTSLSNNMPDYIFELENNQNPRDNKKLKFQSRPALPASIRLDILKALKEHRNFGRAIMTT